ncbi:hypothetical protein [Methanobrevibacter sp.]|uniref:hypothetical protein n=1 Tax=Methanobrevibacter sp. TaxID=66852 RepID=UPI002E7A3698|nr:hypothetical protein [Methanobrevibacter sp.]MEE0940231.1 hypothetical protein [Methanobrevibacter sp.]
MILKDLLDYFNIEDNLPDYLLEQPFNEVFLDGDFEKTDDTYKIEVTTRQDVTHQMFIRPEDEFPLTIMSVLPNGNLNGMKFGQNKGDVTYINEL